MVVPDSGQYLAVEDSGQEYRQAAVCVKQRKSHQRFFIEKLGSAGLMFPELFKGVVDSLSVQFLVRVAVKQLDFPGNIDPFVCQILTHVPEDINIMALLRSTGVLRKKLRMF